MSVTWLHMEINRHVLITSDFVWLITAGDQRRRLPEGLDCARILLWFSLPLWYVCEFSNRYDTMQSKCSTFVKKKNEKYFLSFLNKFMPNFRCVINWSRIRVYKYQYYMTVHYDVLSLDRIKNIINRSYRTYRGTSPFPLLHTVFVEINAPGA